MQKAPIPPARSASEGAPRIRRVRILWVLIAVLVIALGVVGIWLLTRESDTPPVTMPPAPAEASGAQVQQICGACHAYPRPETLSRWAWRKEVKQGYDFLLKDPRLRIDFPPLESVALYYEKRAPERLPLLDQTVVPTPLPVSFESRGFPLPDTFGPPGVVHVSLVHLLNKDRPDVLVCDALNHKVLVLKPYENPPAWQVLAKGVCCARAEVVDLDGDGHKDVLLACLGSFFATDDKVGGVVWLRGSAAGNFAPVTLLDGVGRVADVQAADFNGDGKLDLVVAIFGWRQSGEILLLENRTTDWSKPTFVAQVLDERHGTIHVPVADLNGDNKPDFVALISQEHETVVAFLNEGNGRFRKETIYTAPHPAFGCSGIQLVDLDGDKDLDVLLSNGDALDAPYLLKPYHGVQWLENRGRYPFVHHRLADVYGACRAVAADVTGNGKLLDVVAVSFLPAEYFPQRRQLKLDSVLFLQQTEPGKFVRHALEISACDHPTCAVGDIDGDGRADLVIGNFIRGERRADAVTIWKNLGPKQR